jgi:subtilisin family serine protease
VRKLAVLGGLSCLVFCAPAARAQRPNLASSLQNAIDLDTTVSVWLFVRPGVSLDRVAATIGQTGGTVRRHSRWLHAVSANLPRQGFDAARDNPDLVRIQPVRRFRRREVPVGPPTAPPEQFGAAAQDSGFGPSGMPFRRLNMFRLVEHGFRGAGVRIAVFDTGFETELPAFAGVAIAAQHDFVFNDSIVRNEPADQPLASQHGTQVWSLLAADIPDTLVGIAPQATYLLAKTEDVRAELPIEEDNYVAALEWADSVGVDIISSSVGYTTFDDGTGYTSADLNGDIAVTTVAADLAASRGILVVTAMGNGGPAPAGSTTMLTPADGDSVIAVGAEDSTGVLAFFSSRGPTADGRIKPNLTAPGVAVWVATPTLPGMGYSRGSGTSFATPLVAGAAALIKQIHPTLKPTDIGQTLQGAASNSSEPDNDVGWGRPDVLAAASFPKGVLMVSPVGSLLTSVTPIFEWSVPDVPAFAQPISATLRVARDTSFAALLIDTTVTDSAVTLLDLQFPGEQLVFELTVVSADSATMINASDAPLVAPEWVELLTLNEPAGTTIRAFRPRLAWQTPDVVSPPGPFTFDLAVIRSVDGEIELTAEGLAEAEYIPDRDLERNTPYRWIVTARLGDDSVRVESLGTFIIVDDTAPPITTLFQNFPNPFPSSSTGQSTTCIWFDLAVAGVTGLDILDLRGHVVRTLIPRDGFGPFLVAGRFGRAGPPGPGACDPRVQWDGTAEDRRVVPAGIYLVKLATSEGTFFKRIVFLGGS